MPSSRGSSQPRPTSLASPALAVRFLTTSATWKSCKCVQIPVYGLSWWVRCKKSACNAGDPGSIPGSRRPLEKGMGNHSSILAQRIPWTEAPGRLQSWSHRGLDMNEQLILSLSHTCLYTHTCLYCNCINIYILIYYIIHKI